jgi:gentisate 1,2-dioxygenase
MAQAAAAAEVAGRPAFVAEVEKAHLHPLWDRYKRITPFQPMPQDTPFHWPWKTTEELLHRAVAEVSIEDIERRALIMSHPVFGQETSTTPTMLGAFTVLDPGEQARPHRHTGAAIRFATKAEGAATIVNGRWCDMKVGDLILTPPYAWHGHINPTDKRIIWFDAANMPLLRGLNAHFFEPGDPKNEDFWKVDEGDEKRWRAAGLAVANAPSGKDHSPKYRYSGEATRQMLSEIAPGPDGAKLVRYINPETGGAVMPTLDCYAMRLSKNVETRPKRGAYSTICLVVSGEGRSTVGDKTFDWSQHDVFTIPSWAFASHRAISGDADIFMVSDKVVFERLDVLREEMR